MNITPFPEPEASLRRGLVTTAAIDVATGVRELRNHRGLSQNQLAALLDRASRTWISKIENHGAVPGLDSLYRIAKVLRVPVVALFDAEERRNFYAAEIVGGDPFIRELAAHLSVLGPNERDTVSAMLWRMCAQGKHEGGQCSTSRE
jgi:transcriptional regulator with XRE-family HTH domain